MRDRLQSRGAPSVGRDFGCVDHLTGSGMRIAPGFTIPHSVAGGAAGAWPPRLRPDIPCHLVTASAPVGLSAMAMRCSRLLGKAKEVRLTAVRPVGEGWSPRDGIAPRPVGRPAARAFAGCTRASNRSSGAPSPMTLLASIGREGHLSSPRYLVEGWWAREEGHPSRGPLFLRRRRPWPLVQSGRAG